MPARLCNYRPSARRLSSILPGGALTSDAVCNLRTCSRDDAPDAGRLDLPNQVDAAYVAAGWIFAAFRVLHSAVHCTFNLVVLRFGLYVVATIAVWFMLVRAALGYFGAGA